MPAPRIFTEDELTLARDMRAKDASWYAIGRELHCHDNTIRCALDPDYRRDRFAKIIARRQQRNAKAKAKRETTEARSASAYGASRIQSGHPKRLGIHPRQGLRGIY